MGIKRGAKNFLFLAKIFFERCQRLIAHVMLDPLGIAFRGFLIDPKAQEEGDHDPVPSPAGLGQSLSFLGKEDRSVTLSPNETRCPEA